MRMHNLGCSLGAAEKAEFAAAGEVEGRELLEECKAKERDSTWGSKWHRWARVMGINGEMDMSTQPLKLEVCGNLKTFMRSIRKCSASPSANPSEIYYPPKSYAGSYWALGRLYREQYFERWGNTDEKDRPPMVEWSKDRDLSLIVKPAIAAEMQMVIEKLGNSIHDNEVETLPIDTADRFFNPSAGIMNHITGEGVNNLLAWQNLLLHGVRGYSSLHQLEYPSSYDLKFDPMLNTDTITLSEYESNKTFKPSVECPSAKREMPVAFAIPDDPLRCGVFTIKNLAGARPKCIKSGKKKGHPCPPNLFLRPIPEARLAQLHPDYKSAPFGSIVLFEAKPLGEKSIGAFVSSWCGKLGLEPTKTLADGTKKGYSNSSVRHLLARLMRENGVDAKVTMDSGGWRSEKGLNNYGTSTRMALHDAFLIKAGVRKQGDALRMEERKNEERKKASMAPLPLQHHSLPSLPLGHQLATEVPSDAISGAHSDATNDLVEFLDNTECSEFLRPEFLAYANANPGYHFKATTLTPIVTLRST